MQALSKENLKNPNIYCNYVAAALMPTIIDCAHNYSPFCKKKTTSSVSVIISIRGLYKGHIQKADPNKTADSLWQSNCISAIPEKLFVVTNNDAIN